VGDDRLGRRLDRCADQPPRLTPQGAGRGAGLPEVPALGDNPAVSSDGKPSDELRCICENVIAKARKRTRYNRSDRIDDAQLLNRLLELAQAEARDDEAQDYDPLDSLEDEAGKLLRDALITSLLENHALEDVAAVACEREGVTGCEPQVAYCLVVLCQKADPARTPPDGGAPRRSYVLDVGEEGFDERLRIWAATIARNLRESQIAYRKIFEEARKGDIETARGLCWVGASDSRADLVDVWIELLTAMLIRGQPLEQMSLDSARDKQPLGAEYVFQGPLRRWVRTSITRRFRTLRSRAMRPEPEPEPEKADGNEAYDALTAWLDADGPARSPLPKTIELVDAALREAANSERDDADDSALREHVLPVLEALREDLGEEKRLLGQLVAYVVLAMRKSEKRQVVTILSLRVDNLDAAVRNEFIRRMRAIVDGDATPPTALVGKVKQATTRRLVPASRLRQLARLRDDRAYRATTHAQLASVLGGLPATVATSLAAIAEAAHVPEDSVRAGRNQAADELAAVHVAFGRTFRRYAMRRHGLPR
jgi:hypothetical protein